MGLTVIILSKKDSNLEVCLGAVHALEPGIRTIVVDDGLSMAWGETILGDKPFVFARNANLGIKQAWPDDVILLNDDAILQRNERWPIARGHGPFIGMQCAAQGHPEFGVVSAAVQGPSNSREHQPHAYPHMKELFPEADLETIRQCQKNDVPFVCVLIPRRTIDRVGLLDERFYGEIDGEMVYGGEDTDYCYRVRWAGLKLGIFDGCVVDHSKLPSTFRPDGRGLPINATRKRFKEIHGIDMLV